MTTARRSTLGEIRSLGVFGRAWALGIIAFSIGRALIAWPTLGNYGVNPWWFLFVDLVTAPPYGVAQAVTVKLLRDKERPTRDAVPWAVVVTVMFLAPYIFIFVASFFADSPQPMPTIAYAGVVLWMVVFGVLAALRMRRQVRGDEHGPSTGR
jgi:drug/metabolite transporter (DMT)-like permease